MEKKKRSDQIWILFFLISFILIIILVAGSMVALHHRMEESKRLLSDGADRSYEKYYMMIVDQPRSPFWQSVYQGAQEYANGGAAFVELNGNLLYGEYDKYEQMEIAIGCKPDGIIVQADESPKMTKLISKAIRQGIPVMTVLSDSATHARQSFIGISGYNMGKDYGSCIIDLLTESSKIKIENTDGEYSFEIAPLQVLVLLDDEKNMTNQNTILAAILESIEVKGLQNRIQVDTAVIDSSVAFASEEAIRNIFLESDRIPDVFVCLNEQNTTGVAQAVVDYNRVGEVHILGYYDSDSVKSALEKGIVDATVTTDTAQMGQYCIQALEEYRQFGYVSDYFSVDTTLLKKEQLEEAQEDE